MGQEDEIVTNYIENYLSQLKTDGEPLCPKQMQLYLTGFLEDKTPKFMEELFALIKEAT